ncbi:MAG: 50S ribosomal protein L6 [Desulfobacterales bacterium]|jgi:large subunit ribosomal protein L6|nr:50S ribosomal protein L6 [Desulfobacterales bacterium]MDH3829718.1 50S ribosomal protein L6 [Desulfobacterales bacterium]MDH3877901.1 50S ribosomal protein L6 [Desulfobacterales bacterium]MDH4011276.1 50S ribosomal protein L6 [Desulfobacterales bacterium]
MSRVGKKPVVIPEKTKVSYENRVITVQGEKGTLTQAIHPAVDLKIEDGVLNVVPFVDKRTSRALQGLTRSLVANMIAGVNQGFERTLVIEGIGYRAETKGNAIVLNVGYSNPVQFDLPEGVSASVDRNTIIKLSSIDKEKLGRTAAAIRKIRPPEPYKGKGIKYADERIRRKAGKAGVTAAQ